jgi:hypothetical protein
MKIKGSTKAIPQKLRAFIAISGDVRPGIVSEVSKAERDSNYCAKREDTELGACHFAILHHLHLLQCCDRA